MYRIRYWYQETIESGRWCLTGLMSKKTATAMAESNVYERAEILPDSEYKKCGTCANRVGEDCEKHGGREIYMEDVCDDWVDE